MPETRILMGTVGRPHGVRGLVHVHSFTAAPADLATYGPLVDDTGRGWTLSWRGAGVAELRDASGRALADRTAAEKLTNARLYLDRAQLPAVEEEEFYHSDLLGLAARGMDGAELGRVEAVHDYGAGVSLEIAREGAAPLLVPFTREAVPVVDVRAGLVVIDPPVEIVVEDRPGSGAERAA
jgi:16S rRNA processing protein RimM